jgi:hypothetical protein
LDTTVRAHFLSIPLSLLLNHFDTLAHPAQGVTTAFDGAPRQLCFLEGMAPFTRLLVPAQRKYVGVLLEGAIAGLDEEVR